MKNRKQKASEYQNKYSHIPLDYQERLQWLYDTLKITPNKAEEILNKRDAMLSSLYFTETLVILYEEPEGAKRPRTRLINRKNLANMAYNNPDFIHIYSPNAKEDGLYMKRLVSQEDFIQLDGLVCTPCDLEHNTFIKTPSYYSKTDTYLSEIGLIRPMAKPDWDNIGKKYSDMYNQNIWLDDAFVIEGTVRKFYSVLPRIEIRLKYLNMVYNKHQYSSIINRSDYNDDYNLKYFGGS